MNRKSGSIALGLADRAARWQDSCCFNDWDATRRCDRECVASAVWIGLALLIATFGRIAGVDSGLPAAPPSGWQDIKRLNLEDLRRRIVTRASNRQPCRARPHGDNRPRTRT